MPEILQKILKPRRLSSLPIFEILKKNEINIYIAGPISFVEDLQDYRRQLAEGLKKISPKFVIHDPWEREQATLHGIKFSDVSATEERKAMAEDVIIADLKDIAECDMVLAFMFRIGVGTSMEIFWASRILGKPVILIYTIASETESDGLPLWLYGHANLVFQSKRGLYTWLKKAFEELSDGEETKGKQ